MLSSIYRIQRRSCFFVAEGVHISGGLGDGRSPVGLRGTSAVRVLLPCPRRKNKTLDL